MSQPSLVVRPLSCTLVALGALFAAGCAKPQPAAGPDGAQATAPAQTSDTSGGEAHGGAHPDMRAVCPMAVPGTTASAEDVEGGAALVLTTTGDKTELQRRARAFAEMQAKHAEHGHECDPASCPMHEKHAEHAPGRAAHGQGHGAGHGQGHGAGHGHGHHGDGCCSAGAAGATASVEDTDGGARIVYRPTDAAQLDAVRDHVRHKADKMNHCPMRAEPAAPPAAS